MATPPASPSPPLVHAGAEEPDVSEELPNIFSLSINDEDDELVDALKRLSKKSPKLVRSTEHPAPADPTVIIRSWKMNEFKYYDIPSPFPTLARGLFTHEVRTPSGEIRNRIVVRGYDKFFNIGEVPWTKVSCLPPLNPDICVASRLSTFSITRYLSALFISSAQHN